MRLFNLSKLAVRWLRLGISIEHIRPGHPQQNGRHDELAEASLLRQEIGSSRLGGFFFLVRCIRSFNHQRPHEALDMKCPDEIYQPSPRPYNGLPDLDYPLDDKTIVVTRCGHICLGKKKINFSTVFAGQAVGIKRGERRYLAGQFYAV